MVDEPWSTPTRPARLGVLACLVASILFLAAGAVPEASIARHPSSRAHVHGRRVRPVRISRWALVRLGREALASMRTKSIHALKLRDLAPRQGEIIDVDPRHVAGSLNARAIEMARRMCGFLDGVVVDGDWDLHATFEPFTEKLAYRACHMRWVEGRPWEDTELFQLYAGRLERGEPCRFKSHDELVDRYVALDGVFEQARHEGGLSERRRHLVRMSVTRDGRLLWGRNGRHRVAIALIAGLRTMPAKVGYVHRSAVTHFQTLRRERPRASS